MIFSEKFICANASVCQQYLCGAPIDESKALDYTPCSLQLAATLCCISTATMEEFVKFGSLPSYAVKGGMKPPKVRERSPITFDLHEMKRWSNRFRYLRYKAARKPKGSDTDARRERVEKEGLITRDDLLQVLGITYANLSKWVHEFPEGLKQFGGVPAPEFSISSRCYYKPEVLEWCREVRAYLDGHPLVPPKAERLTIRSSELAAMLNVTSQGLSRWKQRGIPQCYKDFGCPELPEPLPCEEGRNAQYDPAEVAKFVLSFKRAQADYFASVREGKQ